MNTISVPVSGGKAFAIIDADDADRVLSHKWCFNKIVAGKYYVHRRLPKADGGKLIKLHRLIMCVSDRKICVDHINGDTLDNRKENLRLCSQGENMRNYRNAWGKEGIRGIQKTRTGKYRARIRFLGKFYNIGTFETQYDASVAYSFASSVMHGEFGSLPGHEKFIQNPILE